MNTYVIHSKKYPDFRTSVRAHRIVQNNDGTTTFYFEDGTISAISAPGDNIEVVMNIEMEEKKD